MVDVVTERQANLHHDILGLLDGADAARLPAGAELYAAAFRPVRRDGVEQIDVWPCPLAVGGALPTLPLGLTAEACVPVDLEATYTDARGRRRLG